MRQEFGAKNSLIHMVALILMGATVLFSCKESIEKMGAIEGTDSLSTQTTYEMNGVRSEYGMVQMSLEAPLMENYTLLPEPFEIFPQGIRITGYTAEGLLESEITAQRAVHKTGSQDRWEGYGNVVIINFITEERVETDTLYWDKSRAKPIYTHAFIKYYSPDRFIQGIGFESDERLNNFELFNPFYSHFIWRDSTGTRQEEKK